MANPLVGLGTLNRLRGSVSPVDFPELNVIAANLAKEGISLSFSGGATTSIDAMTGVVQSPEPYLKAMIKVHLLKTQFLADNWKAQMEDSTLIGDINIVTDSQTLTDYNFTNAAIESVDTLDFSGLNAAYILNISATYYINNSLWEI